MKEKDIHSYNSFIWNLYGVSTFNEEASDEKSLKQELKV